MLIAILYKGRCSDDSCGLQGIYEVPEEASGELIDQFVDRFGSDYEWEYVTLHKLNIATKTILKEE